MKLGLRPILIAVAGLTLAISGLRALSSMDPHGSSPSAEIEAGTDSGAAPAPPENADLALASPDHEARAGSSVLRPNTAPARFRPPADGGEAPLPAGIHEIRVGPEGERASLAIPPRLETGRSEARWLSSERQGLDQDAPAAGEAITATILVLPIEYAGSATLDYQVHTPDLSQCVTVTERFTGPLHGAIPYPGGSVTETIDNQTLYYPSTEPADYARLIFGRTGYTEPIRAGDPNLNDGAGVDISGLTVQSYFDAQSDGRVAITGTIAPWVALDMPEAYYGIDQCLPGFSPRAIPDEQLGSLTEMTVDAAEKLKTMDPAYASHEFWRSKDTDGDGIVDSLWVIHAGRGQEYGGGSEGEQAIWSRAIDIPGGHVIHDGGTPDDESDDIRLGPVAIMPEDSDIGVMIEEFGHSFFDVPDLYTTDASNSVGWWAPMSSGIWGGDLGGVRPVNMPLWFRMTAACGGQPCGWAEPVASVSYTTAGETVVLGQAGTPAGGTVEDPDSPYFGQTIHEGLRVDLPTQVESLPNRAGDGGGAYTGPGSGSAKILDRQIDLDRLPAGDGPFLHLGAYWSIPRFWGWFHVEVDPDGDGEYESLPDLDGHFLSQEDDPFGLNSGWGATGQDAEPTTLRFDLSAWRGQQLPLRLRYITFRGGPGTGVWVDDAAVVINELGQDLRFEVDDFEAGLGDWQVQGWEAVPYTLHHPHHYLVEWRNADNWDRSLLGAYQTNYRDADEWRVDRVPANLPGALVMYRNLKYPFSGALEPQMADPPSWGAKYGLLVVDPNYPPVERPSGGPFSGALQSLDAALALGQQPDFSLEWRDPETKEISATDRIEGRLGVTQLDDARGYTPGQRADAEGQLSAWDADASAVLPSQDGGTYSTRVVDAEGQPAFDHYGRPFSNDHVLGSGNPGDANLQLGVHIELVDQAADGSWGAVRVFNQRTEYRLDLSSEIVTPGELITATITFSSSQACAGVEGCGTWQLELPPGLSSERPTEGLIPFGSSLYQPSIPLQIAADMAPGSDLRLHARFTDLSEYTWFRWRDLAVIATPEIYLPAILRSARFDTVLP